ncbi:MAG: hypothetical protein H0X27_08280 [Caulobacteraceae bacterium]|nr:hypothetical protein [Caulobacteraceae bacterium]
MKGFQAALCAAFALCACDRGPAPVAAPRAAESPGKLDALAAKVAALDARVAAMEAGRAGRTYTLTETWLVPGQPAISSQTPFSSPGACEAARRQALADLAAAAQQQAEREKTRLPGVVYAPRAPPPTLTAFCST